MPLTDRTSIEMIYLASPYSHPDPAVREERFRAACRATAALIRSGRAVYSPVVFGHPLTGYDVPTGWEFWATFDREHLLRCDHVIVLTLEGWRESEGVRVEMRVAEENGI